MPNTNKEVLMHGATFGEFSRYQLIRHESHRGAEFNCWMVLDAERIDEVTGCPSVARIGFSVEEVIKGLL